MARFGPGFFFFSLCFKKQMATNSSDFMFGVVIGSLSYVTYVSLAPWPLTTSKGSHLE